MWTLILNSCTPISNGKLRNPHLLLEKGSQVPEYWQVTDLQQVEILPANKTPEKATTLRVTRPGRIRLSQKVHLDSGDYFLLAKLAVSLQQGGFYLKTSSDKYFLTGGYSKKCERAVFALSLDKPQSLEISLGMLPGSVGQVTVFSVQTVLNNYTFPYVTDSVRQHIKHWASIHGPFVQDLDKNVRKLAKAVNSTFLSGYSHTLPNLLTTDQAPYLLKFLADTKVETAYCQKSSLSLDDLLRVFHIPTRQIHWQKECVGFHQFLEYFDKKTGRWKIIDPYYGISYRDSAGKLLGFEEIEQLKRRKKLAKHNILKINTGRLLYDEEEILDGWYSSSIAVHVK